ncbi:hypothetical protein HUW51_00925 (plasmid) [Adhaeribacter swui]|uniref:Uncharacterized protein n=1 Tax=Adhaeribacter swui TaxID=2086471 RepID=A0A7G7G2G7_9BACT|nr:hypothetical protein [Adhaeribacter swui]QNF31351.1 hypothetical protein HUW51_00925 [Adhaeribacter swui]
MGKPAILICLLGLTLFQVKAQTPPVPVKSPNTRYQLEREVVTRWNKFNPKWYFILFHNKYRKGPDRRNIKQLMPIMALTRINASAAEEEEERVDELYNQEMFKLADRSLNKNFYLLYENKIKKLNQDLALLQGEAVLAGVDLDMLLALRGEQERIKSDIDLTKESYQDDAKKAEQFRVALTDLTTLRGYYRRLINLFKTSNKLLNK